ncbi:unnamed protein product [Lymnaea stagnalis]|uniref:Uncharacterized protein n=1 Tax=Lymnaea stagnalis TaxID=6523 RepID=A0AAV2IDZ2_LYMST
MNNIDLTHLVKSYFEPQLEDEVRKRADKKNPVIDWSLMTKTFGPTVYLKSKETPKPKMNILFSANFENTTPKPQVYTLKTDRKTQAVTDIMFKKSYTVGGEIEATVGMPVDAGGLLKADFSRVSGNRVYNEQELTWGVDSEITVEPGHCVRAELVVKESDFSGEFEEVVTFDGDVAISYYHKKEKYIVETLEDSVAKIFVTKHGFGTDIKGRPTFNIRGVCKCKYGMEQFINLIEREGPCDKIITGLQDYDPSSSRNVFQT